MEILLIIVIGVIFAFSHSKLQSRITILEEKLKGTVTPSPNIPNAQISAENQPFDARPVQVVPVPDQEKNASFVQSLQENIQTGHFATENIQAQNDSELQGERRGESFLSPTPSVPDPIMVWFSHNTLIKVGSLLFFFGAVWFVSYAISQGWISPFMRIFVGILCGVGVCILGIWRKKNDSEQYLTLTTLGLGIIIASIFTGQFLFNLFSPFLAFFLLVCTIGYAVAVSLDMQKQWLCVLSAIASLFIPILVHAPNLDPILFLSYFLIISVAFLGVVFKTNWRHVTLTLSLGTTFFLWATFSESVISDNVLFIFVILFSALFYGASTVSMSRNNEVQSIDMLILGTVIVPFIMWTQRLAVFDGLVTFTASSISAITGYVLYLNQRSEKLIAVYTSISAVLVLIATLLTFDGYVLTMVYTFEIGSALILGMYLKLPSRITIITSYAFALPVILSVREFFTPEWSTGIWHASGVTLYALLLTTGALSVYAIDSSRRIANPLHQYIGGVFLFLFWFYAYTCTWLVWDSLFAEPEAFVLQYIMWAVISTLILLYVLLCRLPQTWVFTVYVSFIIPVSVSFSSLYDPLWATSWLHANALGLYFMNALSLGLGVWFLVRGIYAKDASTLSQGGGWFVLFGLYATVTVFLFWGAVCGDETTANVLRYLSWTILISTFAYCALHLQVPSWWLSTILWIFTLPVIASFASFASPLWVSSWTHLDAVGLYILTTLLILTALALYSGQAVYSGDRKLLEKYSALLWVVVGMYLVALVWRIAHAVFISTDVAVSVALFVYTVSGLTLYMVGKSQNQDGVRYAGITLLCIVVARLLIIDVWGMEVIGRIVTFLGVGLLFILTALFEKPFEKIRKTDTDIPPSV